MLVTKKCQTFFARIYIAGPIEVAEQIIRSELFDGGMCVNISPNKYIYKRGEEFGYVVEIINYPRFPESSTQLKLKAEALGIKLLEQTFQGSMTIVYSDGETYWYSNREDG